MSTSMRKSDVDNIAKQLIKDKWHGKSIKDFEQKLGNKYTYDQLERIRARFNYFSMLHKELEIRQKPDMDNDEKSKN